MGKWPITYVIGNVLTHLFEVKLNPRKGKWWPVNVALVDGGTESCNKLILLLHQTIK